MEVSAELGDDMVTIMSGADQFKISHAMKFFWEKQQKCLNRHQLELDIIQG